ncbi:MAG: 3D domain-containing protein [Clostridium sp.]
MRNATNENSSRFFSTIPKAALVVTAMLIIVTAVVFNMRKIITVSVNNEVMQITTLKSNLKEVLDAKGIEVGKKDKISVNLDSEIKDGDVIDIKRAVKVKVLVDNEEIEVLTAEDNIDQVLQVEGIIMDELDKIEPGLEEEIIAGLSVKITRVKQDVIDEIHEVAFEKEYNKTDELEQGTEEVVQEGKYGERLISSRITYEDGMEVSREVINDEIKKEPVKQLIALGTLGVYRPSRGSSQTKFNYSKVLDCEATAYNPLIGSSRAITATGTVATRNPGGYSTIAVDPSVIPLGTKVYVEGYGYAIAEDTGGAIKGNIIDVFLSSYNESCNWGRKKVKVYIIK